MEGWRFGRTVEREERWTVADCAHALRDVT
jgi:hypothetical protein